MISKLTLKLVQTLQKHSIFPTSWEALYFYGFYFEAVTSTQKFTNSFSKDPQKGVPAFKRPLFGPLLPGPLREPLFRHFIIIISTIIFKYYSKLTPKLVQTLQKHSIFTTSWEALYFYRNYFEAVTSTQKFANSFYGTPFLGVPTFKRPLFGPPSKDPFYGPPPGPFI
jgi:hypothetical protein